MVQRMVSKAATVSLNAPMPKRRAGLIERELPQELILYDPQADRAFLLNYTSAAIWDLCDGHNSTQEIAAQIARHYDASERRVLEDVERTVTRFARDKLLEAGSGLTTNRS